MFDIMMTATCRTVILKRTLESFCNNLFKDSEPRLIINIDPVGPNTQEEVETLCHDYFNNILVNKPLVADFPTAFKWCWLQAEAPYVFNLEDDWILRRAVCLDDMLAIMESNSSLAVLRLPQWPTGELSSKNWRYFYPWNGRYFYCKPQWRREVGFCGHPSLLKGEYVKRIAPLVRTDANPEKQFHQRGTLAIMDIVTEYDYGVYGVQNQPGVISDIGREWMVGKYIKKSNKANFKTWEKLYD